MAPLGKIATFVAAIFVTAGIALGAEASAEKSVTQQANTGELVYYEHLASPGGAGYQPRVNGSAVRYDGTTNPKTLAERTSTWMHMNLYWDTDCNNYAATWEQNVDSYFTAAYWGWNSYLGGVGMVNFPDTIDSFQAGKTIVFSTSPCPCPNCENYYFGDGWCQRVGFTPYNLWVYTASCDSGNVGAWGHS